MIDLIIIIIALIALIYGSYSDIKTREVPDWANYGLLAVALALRLIFSLAEWNFSYLLEGLIGFGAMFILALLMFYSGQWGGGDSKFIMGFGALLGLNYKTILSSDLLTFLITSLFIGAIFALVWSTVLAIKNKKEFKKELSSLRDRYKKIRLFMIVFLVVAVIASFIITSIFVKLLIFGFFSVGVLTFYMFMFVKAVESTCMIKSVPLEKVTEGDWILEDVKVKGKHITGPKELGITIEQIKQLRKLKKQGKLSKNFKMKVKYGIPFVPSFMIAYIIILIFGNWLSIVF